MTGAAVPVIPDTLIATEAHMSLRRLISDAMNGLAAMLIAVAIFFTLANTGLIARPSIEHFSFGG